MATATSWVPRPRTGVGRWMGWSVGGLGLLLTLLILAAVITTPSLCSLDGGSDGGSGGAKLADGTEGEKVIPADFAAAYRKVAQESGVPAPVLATVGYIETKHGRLTNTSSMGAQGPMQFLPSTWVNTGCAGSIMDLEPAVTCAAKYLTALAEEPGAKRPGTDRWTYAMCRYNGGCALGIRAEAGYGAAGEVAGRIAREYGYVPGEKTPILAGAGAPTAAACAAPATATGSAGDVTAAVAPLLNKSWSEALAAGLKSLGWPTGTAWCQLFVQNILDRLGIARPTPNSAHSSDPYTWATTWKWGTVLHGPGKPSTKTLQLAAGDIVMYGSPGPASSHVNMVESVDSRGVLVVGGNQSCGKPGNCVTERGPIRLTGGGGSLRWSSGDTRPIWAIVRPPAPGKAA